MDNLSKSFASSPLDCQPHRPQPSSWDHKPHAMIMPAHLPWPSPPCRPWDFWDDPSSILPHKHSPELHRSQPVAPSSSLGIDDSGILMACQPRSSVKDDFPFSAVSGSRAIPFACKLDVGASEESDLGFASLSGFSDEESNPSGKTTVPAGGFHVKVEMDESQGNVQDPVGLDGRGPLQASHESGSNKQGCTEVRKHDDESKGVMVKKELQQQADKHGVSVAQGGDTAIGLKLGKRTYFEDGGAGGGGEATRRTSSGAGNNNNDNSNSNNNNNNSNSNNNAGNKKQKVSSVTTNLPKCQAEGCLTDLSTSKDYHRRHKVCEWHSKASKVKVGNLEQRFCQQCSRFHVLSEFDEGKRSCRRRLAGHNERRRKQQPDAMPLLSSGSYPYLPDKHLLNNSLLEHHCFLQHQRSAMASSLDQAALACQLRLAGADTQILKLLRIPKEEPMTNFPSLELHHFMQDSGALMGGHGFQPPGALHIGPETLPCASQTASGMAVSGRALSLLSSSSGSPSIPCSMSLAISPHHSPFVDQLLAENQAASSRQTLHKTSGSQTCFAPVSDKLMGMAPMPLGLTNSNGSVSGFSNTVDREQNCDGRSMFIMLQQNEFQGMQGGDSQHGRPILDLMHSPSPQSQGSRPAALQQPIGIQYADFEGLRSYESMFGRQNIM